MDFLNYYRIDDLERHVWGAWEHDEPPEYTEFFRARRFGYASHGLDVSALSRRLRAHAALPNSPQEPDACNRDDELRSRRTKYEGATGLRGTNFGSFACLFLNSAAGQEKLWIPP